MSVIGLIIALALIGFALWAVNTYIPMQPPFKQLLNIIVFIVVILWLLNVFGLLTGLGGTIPVYRR